MRLGCEMHDGVHRREQLVEEAAVADVALDEGVARRVGNRREVLQVARIREGVEDDDLRALEAGIGVLEGAPDEIGADETGTAGDEDLHGVVGAFCRQIAPESTVGL